MTDFSQNNNKQSGNILIYILGAIFLLGLLIVTIRGSNTSSSGVTEENMMIRISEIQQYGAELENSIAFILQKGFSETEIKFSHPDADPNYGLISDNPERQVFHRDGGAATYRKAPKEIQSTPTQWLFNAQNNIPLVGSTNNSNSNNDVELIAFLPNVTKQFCVTLNEKLGITNPSNSPPNDNGGVEFSAEFNGSFDMSETIGDSGNLLDGKTEGCFEGGGSPPSGTYHYYRALLIR